MKKIYLLVVIIITITVTAFTVQNNGKISIVVAANMKPAMDSIISVYKSQHPREHIQVIYGASGKFYEQIVNGAPFDIFYSADMNYPIKLRDNKIAISKVKLYAIGRLAMWSKKIDPNKNQMNTLTDASIHKVSIANPATAPYGAKAVESMKYYKVYDKVKPNLVYGENIAQAVQFVAFGAADVGIIALSECLSPNTKKEGGKYWVIPQESHKPLEQGCVILKQAKDNAAATKFYDFISSQTAKAILTYYGYSLPQNN